MTRINIGEGISLDPLVEGDILVFRESNPERVILKTRVTMATIRRDGEGIVRGNYVSLKALTNGYFCEGGLLTTPDPNGDRINNTHSSYVEYDQQLREADL